MAAKFLYFRMLLGFYLNDRSLQEHDVKEHSSFTIGTLQLFMLNFIFALLLTQFGILSRYKKISMFVHSIAATFGLFLMIYGKTLFE